MKSYFIDTNVFLRFIVQDHPQHYIECKTFFDSLKHNTKARFYTSSFVVTEIAYTLSSFYNFKKPAIVSIIETIAGMPQITLIDNVNLLTAVSLFKNHTVKFVDCLLASIAGAYDDMTIISYDTDFDKIGLKRVTPREIEV